LLSALSLRRAGRGFSFFEISEMRWLDEAVQQHQRQIGFAGAT
jgi:hypothetical protein